MSQQLASDPDELQRVDDEIAQLSEAVRRLKMRHNNLITISVLPNEIILEIFVTLVQDTEDSHFIIPLSSVSQRWRQIAVDYAILWSFFDLNERKIHPELYSRSGQAPLSLNVALDSYSIEFVRKLLSEETHRIRALWLEFGFYNEAKDLYTHLCKPMPLLEVVTISSREEEPRHLPGLFGGDQAFRLRELNLRGVSTDCFSSFSRLTHLNLAYDTHMDPIVTLAHMPCLQELDLTFDNCPSCPDDYAGDPPHAGSIIELSALQKVKLGAELRHCAFLLNHLHFPAATFIDLYTVTGNTSGMVRPLGLMQFITNRTSIISEKLQVTCHDYSFRFLNATMDWTAQMRCVTENLVPVLDAFCQSTELQSIEFNLGCWDATTFEWPDVFVKFKGVRRLEVGLHDAEKMLKALTKSTTDVYPSGTRENLLLPRLEELTVKIMAEDDNSDNDRFNQLVQFLRARKAANFAPTRLNVLLEGENIEKLRVDELSQLEEFSQVAVETFG